MKRFLVCLWQDEDASAMVEYAVLMAFVALATAPVATALRGALQTAYERWNAVETDFWQVPPCGAC